MVVGRAARAVTVVFLLPALGSFAACASEAAPPAQGVVGGAAEGLRAPRYLSRLAMPMRDDHGVPLARHAPASAAAARNAGAAAPLRKLTYRGGPVISNVKVYAVFWGPRVNVTVKARLPGYYTAITSSPYFDWLTEYDTVGTIDGAVGTGQRIGRGSYGGDFTLTPINTATTLSDADIGAELAAQIQAGKLPAPELDALGYPTSLYMFDFPPGISLTLGPDASCVQFCAYHSSQTINGKEVPFGVHPDMGPGSKCANGCGYDASFFNNVTDVHAHELIEAVTDTSAIDLSWYSDQEGEIGDICATGATEAGIVDGYVVQKEWSNVHGDCIVSNVCDGTVAPPACVLCTAADCGGSTPFCDTTPADAKYGQCVQCVDDTGCSALTPVCDKTAGAAHDTCRACTAEAECPGAHCALGATDVNKGACVQCITNAQCTAPLHCVATTDRCVECTSSLECANPKPVCGTGLACRGCTLSAECAGNPKGNACAADGTCVECAEDTDCADANKPVCDTMAHACVAGTPGDAGSSGSSGTSGSSGGTSGASGGTSGASGGTSGASGNGAGGDDAGTGGGGASGCAVGAVGAPGAAGGTGSTGGLGGVLFGLVVALRARSRRRR